MGGPGVLENQKSLGKRRRHPFTMRTKLIVAFVALIVGVGAVIGVATELFLSSYLQGQLDQRLAHTGERFHQPSPGEASQGGSYVGGGNTQDTTPVDPGSPGRLGNEPGTLGALISHGAVTQCSILTDSAAPPLSSGTSSPAPRQAVLQRLDTKACSSMAGLVPGVAPVTVDVPGVGQYRVKAFTVASGLTSVAGVPEQDRTNVLSRLAWILSVVTVAALLVGAGIIFLVVRREVRPLERIAAIARQVSTLPLDKGDVVLKARVPDADTDERTEVGQVGIALNQMLGNISSALEARQASEMQVRQFVADASHELRTPLAAIRGYAELARRGQRDPETVTHVLGRVESESARMTTLVEDLLLLARLDSGRPLQNEEVDMTMLLINRVSDARVAGPEHRWMLRLPEEPVIIFGDSARLHQVVANLLSNAKNHTTSGSVVVAELSRDPKGIELTVTDDGPGIPSQLQKDIFKRFVRGDSSRSRAAGSTGLGLAIVSAVVGSHGGCVSVESAPGHTRFSVRLPYTQVTQQPPPSNLLPENTSSS